MFCWWTFSVLFLYYNKSTTDVYYPIRRRSWIFMDSIQEKFLMPMTIWALYKQRNDHIPHLAPAASRITVFEILTTGREWDMHKVSEILGLSVPGTKEGMMYKYCIYDRSGNRVEHCDPWLWMELHPGSACYKEPAGLFFPRWRMDGSPHGLPSKPLNIYELYFGSFKSHQTKQIPGIPMKKWQNPDSLCKNNGYNYLEIMPLNEYPAMNLVIQAWAFQPHFQIRHCGSAEIFCWLLSSEWHWRDHGTLYRYICTGQLWSGSVWRDSSVQYPHSAVGVRRMGKLQLMHSRVEKYGASCSFCKLLDKRISYRRLVWMPSAGLFTGRGILRGA